jgi:hypothetical protein
MNAKNYSTKSRKKESPAKTHGIHRAVLAENVTVKTTGEFEGLFCATFDFLCPHCGRRHCAQETAASKFGDHFLVKRAEIESVLAKLWQPADADAPAEREIEVSKSKIKAINA